MAAWSKGRSSGNEAAVVAACYEAAVDPSLWPAALDLVAGACAADSAILIAGDRDTRNSAAIATGIGPNITTAYTEHAWSSPLASALFTAPLATPARDRQAMPRAHFESSPFYQNCPLYQNWMKPYGPAEGLVSALSPLGPDVMVLALMRDRGPSIRPFTDDPALSRFTAMLPHFARAASIQRRLMRAQALPQGAGAAALQALSVPVMLLNARGRMLWDNDAAEALVRVGDGLISAHDLGLLGASSADTAELCGLLAAAAGGRGGATALRRPSGAPPLLALALPCDPAPDPWRSAVVGAEWPQIMLFIIDPSAPSARHGDTAPAAHLRALFGLTAAEAATALGAGDGEGLPAVARALGVAPGTVRSHAKAVFAKMDVRGQADLARLLARLGLIERS